MFIILTKNEWNRYEIILDCFDVPKIFEAESECFDFCREKNIYLFQIIEVTI